MPWVEMRPAKAGAVDNHNDDGFLVREIMSTRTALAAFREEF